MLPGNPAPPTATTVKSLLMWDNPIYSGAVVSVLLLFIIIFGVMNYTFLTLICRAIQLALIVFAGAAYLGKPLASREQIVAKARELHDTALPHLWHAIDVAARVVTWEDRSTTMEVLVATLMLAMLGNVLSDIQLTFIITLALFVAPVAYAHNKAAVDGHLDTLKQFLDGLLMHGAEGLKNAAISLSPSRREQQMLERERSAAAHRAGGAAGAASLDATLGSTMLDSTLAQMRTDPNDKKYN